MILSNELKKRFKILENEPGIVGYISRTLPLRYKNNLQYLDVAKDNPKLISWLKPKKLEEFRVNWNICGNGVRYHCECMLWDREFRIMGKPGKLLKKLMPELSATDISEWVCKYYGIFCSDKVEFRVVKGTDIPFFYNQNRYDYDLPLGSLGGSCMNHVDDNFFDIYAKNNVKMLMVMSPRDSDLIIGRALIWNNVDMDGKNITFLDRAYGSEHTVCAMLEHAKKQGWHHKTYQNYDSGHHVTTPDGNRVEYKMVVQCDTDFDYYPFLDTFCYASEDELSNCDSHPYNKVFRNTDGTCEGGGVLCEDSGNYVDEDNAYWVPSREEYYEYSESIRGSDYEGEYLHVEDCVYCDIDNDYALEDDTTLLHDGESCITERNDISETYDGEYILADQGVELYDGTIAHEDEEFEELYDGTVTLESDSDIIDLENGDLAIVTDPNVVEFNGEYYLRQEQAA